MGCFLRCFGKSRTPNRRRKLHHKHKVQQATSNLGAARTRVSSEIRPSENQIIPTTVISENNLEGAQRLCVRKKVTFDSNVETYLVEESVDLTHINEDDDNKQFNSNVETYENDLVEESVDLTRINEDDDNKQFNDPSKSSPSQSSTENSSITASSGNHAPKYRYQNCTEEEDEIDSLKSDVEDDDDDDDGDDNGFGEENQVIVHDDGYDEVIDDMNVGFEVKSFYTEEVVDSSDVVEEIPMRMNHKPKDPSQPVLNPVENLTQWNTLKSKCGKTQTFNEQKENSNFDQEPRASFGSEFSLKQKSLKKPNQEVAVDASLSTWLSSGSRDRRSVSPQSFEDRPILGALTVEEIKQFSASNSPRISPSRSPADMPIIGTVGNYWSDTVSSDGNLSSGASFKGIPNTTSKYREDKRVKWHSTPFATRLDRAMGRAIDRDGDAVA